MTTEQHHDNIKTPFTRMDKKSQLTSSRRHEINKIQKLAKATQKKLRRLFVALSLDAICACVLTCIIHKQEGNDVNVFENQNSTSFSLYDLMWSLDVIVLGSTILRATSMCFSLYILAAQRRWSKQDLHHYRFPFGEYHAGNARFRKKKTLTELEEEALEEPFCSWWMRFISRPSFMCEVICIGSILMVIVQCLLRLYFEIELEATDNYDDAEFLEKRHHPLWWAAMCLSALFSMLEVGQVDGCCFGFMEWNLNRSMVNERRRRNLQFNNDDDSERTVLASSSSTTTTRSYDGNDDTDVLMYSPTTSSSSCTLLDPLLAPQDHHNNNNNTDNNNCCSFLNTMTCANTADIMECNYDDEDNNEDDDLFNYSEDEQNEDEQPAAYKATLKDLLALCKPDLYMMMLAFVFLILAALMQTYIPRLIGNVLDALADYESDNDSEQLQDKSDIWNVPGFRSNIQKLVIAGLLCAIFSGLRGGIFTVVGGRVNARLRIELLDSLLAQEIGFFDTTKTGDLSSRLCSDTTMVGDQVTLNVNVFLRSFVQAIGVLVFMFLVSWRLTMLVFLSVPAITIMSKIYGAFMRKLTKLMQKKLADGNTVSEAALSSMPTVRAFGAEEAELQEYKKYMDMYLDLNIRSAVAYVGYATSITALPLMVNAMILFYGGLMVLSENGEDHISSGQLVSFFLYLSSLSDAFNSMGSIFSSLTTAVGAADKVFEMIYRKPRRKTLSISDCDDASRNNNEGEQNNVTCSTPTTCAMLHQGIIPDDDCTGEIQLSGVDMFYPARPTRKVLDGMTLSAPPGTVCALVGPSGGGKSSIVSLIQHLYEQSNGTVTIDGYDIRDLDHLWLSRHVSVVSQEPTLNARSVKRNIMYGLEGTESEPSMEEIMEACQLANAASFIENLPDGYDTEVGERGVQLSGGQKQRIAIARALVRKPRILLLDEATSALDAESESSVQAAIDSMLKMGHDGNGGCAMTVVVVAHRLSTIRSADNIYVVSGGRVAESGRHEDLIQNPDGSYANLINRQMMA